MTENTSITCYGGVEEIGGNKILIQDRDIKIFLDFGVSFGKRAKFFEEYLKPRPCNGFGDLIVTGLLPDLKGIYRKDLVKIAGWKVHKEPEIDAVLLSHAHADHSNYISFLDDEIPIITSQTSHLILKATQEASVGRDFEKEILDYKRRPMLKKDYKQKPTQRKIMKFRNKTKIKIGDIEVIPIHVDHSVPGSYGFIIHTSEKTIVYTGDLRQHGLRSEMTGEFILAASEAEPDILITEGTRVDEEEDENEGETKVRQECSRIIAENKTLTVADFNFKDSDRFKTFYELVRQEGKKIVLSTRDAVMLKYLSLDTTLELPKINDDSIVIFKQKTYSGTYIEEDYQNWEQQLMKSNEVNIKTAKEIKENEQQFIFVGGFFSINDLIDINPSEGSRYIYSHSEPYNEETDVNYKRLQNWIKLLKLKYYSSHCSGHANWPNLKNIIQKINAKKIIPIHTEKPTVFKEINKETIIPKYGVPIEI